MEGTLLVGWRSQEKLRELTDGAGVPKMHKEHASCSHIHRITGIESFTQCAERMEEVDVCGKFFMFAPRVKSWGCFCCTGVEDFKYPGWWNIYAREGHLVDPEGKPAQGFVSQYA